MREVSNWGMLIFLGICSASDVRFRGVYTWMLAGMSGVLAVFCLFFSQESVWSMVGGVFVGMLFLLCSYWTKEGIGYADSWLILLLGSYLGLAKIVLLLTGAFFAAALVALIGMACKRWRKSKGIPFVPFLTAAYIGVTMI